MLHINVWERLRGLMTDGSGGLEGSGDGWAQERVCVCMHVCLHACVCVCVLNPKTAWLEVCVVDIITRQ